MAVDEMPSSIRVTRVSSPSPSRSADVPTSPVPEAEAFAGDDHLGADRLEVRLDERLRLQLLELVVEGEHDRLPHACGREQLEAPLERRQELDAVAQDDPRMWIEREHRRRQAGGDERVEHVAVPEVDAVERADRDRARPTLELARRVVRPSRQDRAVDRDELTLEQCADAARRTAAGPCGSRQPRLPRR